MWGNVARLKAQSPEQFEAYTQLNGLSNEFIQDITEDYLGFIWIATESGINRFDGHKFTSFRHIPGDTTTLAGNFVWKLLEDSKQRLWAGTDLGLNYLDRETGVFELINLDPAGDPTKQYQVRTILEDQHGNIWVGTYANGLKLLKEQATENTWEITDYLHDPADPNSISANLVEQLLEDDQGYIWVGTISGADRLNPQTGQVDHFAVAVPFDDDLIEGFAQSNEKDIFIAGFYQGLFQLSPGDGPLLPRYLTPVFNDPNHPDFISGIRSMALGKKYLWVGTLEGLYQIGLSSSDLSYYQHSPRQTGTLSFNHVNALYEDKNEILWIGTYGGGLNQLSNRPNPFQHYSHDSFDPSTLTNSQVRTILEDSAGYLWVGTLGGGLDKLVFEEEKGWTKIENYQHQPGRVNSLVGNDVITIIMDRNGHIWVGTNGEGLSRLDPTTGTIKNFIHHPNDANSISNNRIWALHEDRDGYIWIGTHSHGLDRLDPRTGQFKHYNTESDLPVNLSNNGIKTIWEDHHGNLWVGTTAGLNKLNPRTGSVEQFLHDPSDSTTLSSNLIWTVFQDHQNILWVGTNLGLNRYDWQTGRFERFLEKDGLPSNAVYGLLEDDQQQLWISTDNGLARYQPSNDSDHPEGKSVFQSFNNQDGLGGDSFLPKAYHKSDRTGQLYFGGLHGLNIIHPDRVELDTTPPLLVLSSFAKYNPKRNNGEAIVDHFVADKKQVVLTHLDKVVTFEFANLSHEKNDKYNYEYQLEGFSDQWIDLGNKKTITFTGLDPGHYRLLVRARTSNQNPTPGTHLLQMTVYPPWWLSWWAYSFYALLIGGAVLFAYQFQLNRQLEKQENRRLKELDAFKSKLYTNITHEFRTPLTIISGMVEQINGHDQEKNMIKRNSSNLLNLVNQILDLRKLESGMMQLELVQDNIIAHLRYIFESFQSFAQSEGITLHFLPDAEEVWMDYDPEKVLRIISNLLSNAIKFTPRGGDVYLIVNNTRRVFKTRRVLLTIKVKDTGIGIPPDKLPRVFDQFYQVEDPTIQAKTGTGIGLTLTKELVNLMQGTITVDSTPGEGSTFTVELPIMQKAKVEIHAAPPETIGTLPLAGIEMEKKEAQDHPTLLIIEDNTDIAQYLISCLQHLYQVEVAENGEEGIDTALDLVPDIIISDVMMPLKDGFEVVDTLKNDERTSHIPIILLTARVDAESRLAGLRRGADAYLTKPFNQEELLIRLENLLVIRKNLQARYHTPTPKEPSQEKSIQIEDEFIKKVKKIIEDHLHDEDFDVNRLCHKVGMSRSNLHRKIKTLTKRSTSHYIRAVRLHKARELLKDTGLNVSEVAYQVGFRDPRYFSRTFSEEFGRSPSELRN